jgi:hypothetical protein
MKYLSYISTTILGLMFLFSAFAKAWDAEAFANMLLLYGPQWFSIGAPIIIMLEAVLGMALVMRVKTRWSAIAADCFLVVVSAIFAYGVLAKGIQDCGCFGVFSKMFTGKPWVTFVRNALFVAISIPAILDSNRKVRYVYPKVCLTIVVAAMACFVCGLSMRKSYKLPKISQVRSNNRSKVMEKLNEIYSFNSDSTYVVYLFSFTCPHCQNSFANVQQFQQFNVADKVIGIAVEDQEAQERFYRIYKPEIDIITIPKEQMELITNQLPIGMSIRENSIKKAEVGFITSPGLFLK